MKFLPRLLGSLLVLCVFLSWTKYGFDKEAYFKECNYSVKAHLLSPEQEKELIYGPNRSIRSDQALYEEFQRTHSYETAKRIIRNSQEGMWLRSLGRGTDSLLFDHMCAYALSKAQTVEDVVHIMLDYSKYESYENICRIGKASIKYQNEIGDSLSYEACQKIVEGTEDMEEARKYSSRSIPLVRRVFGPGTIKEYYALYDCAYCSQVLDGHDTQMADSLVNFIRKYGMLYRGGITSIWDEPLYLRYFTALTDDHDRDYAQELLDILMGTEQTDDYSGLNASSYGEGYFTLLFENARLRYLFDDPTYPEWIEKANNAFLEFLSPEKGNISLTDYLKPDFEFYPKLVDLMSIAYNHPSPEVKYDIALFLKGTSSQISSRVLEVVHESADDDIRNYVDSLRTNYLENPFGLKGFEFLTDERWNAMMDRERKYETKLNSFMTTQGPETIWSSCLATWRDVAASLHDGETAVEIVKSSAFLGDDTYGAIILNRNAPEPIYVELCRDSVLMDAIDEDIYSQDNHAVYDLVIKPLEKDIHGKVLRFSPAGILTTVNLSAIHDGSGTLLSDRYAVIDCISTKSVLEQRADYPSLGGIVLFGGLRYDDTKISRNSVRRVARDVEREGFDYLSHSLSEVRSISRMAKKAHVPNQMVTEFEGTELRFKMLSGKDIPILHVATHGFYYNTDKASSSRLLSRISSSEEALSRCGLVFSYGQEAWKNGLSSSEGNDGILLGNEISKMDLSRTELLVLSACNTAIGEITNEGVAGLQQAFRKAGVKRMLLSLRPVDDEATEIFMTEFYRGLFNGLTYRSAYNSARRLLMKQERFSDPWYWASFILLE